MFTYSSELRKINRSRHGGENFNLNSSVTSVESAKMQTGIQPAKLFDRKNIVNILRALFCCPKCRSEYTHNYDHQMGDNHVKSNRPYLLQCGHNMCENCIHHYHQNLVCAVCQRPVEIPTENLPMIQNESCESLLPQRQNYQNFNVRDYFDLNFFLLGTLNHFRFYRRETAQNTAHPALPRHSDAQGRMREPVIVKIIKCIECDKAADGFCHNCASHYCKSCYDTIHMCGKVLKRHTLSPLQKEEFDYSNSKFCKRHRRVKDRYCKKCDLVLCSYCFKRDHPNHQWCPLHEKNMHMCEDIENILDSVKISRENVRKAQKVSP